MTHDLDAAARSWVAHLRAGGVTPWCAWRDRPSAVGEVDPGPLPGGQQAELVRRLNAATHGSTARGLTEHVLAASAAGRGRPDVVLTQTDATPEALPARELLRVAATVIGQQLLRGAPAASALMDDTAPELPLTAALGWDAYRVVGDPLLATDARRAMLVRGHPPGGRRPLVFVVGTDAATMFTHAWVDRAVDVGGPGWRPWWEQLRSRSLTPARVDLAAAAARWAAEVGRDRVRILLSAEPAALPRRWRPLTEGLGSPGAERLLSADAADLARRTAQVLGSLTDDRTRRRVLHEWLAPTLVEQPGPALRVPDEHREWVATRARDLHERLSAGGYPVVGDLGALVPASGEVDRADTVDRPDPDRVLELAVWLLSRLHEEVEP